MADNLEMRERSKFSKICSVLVDIFFIPVLIFAFVCSMILFSAKSNNKIPTLFGTAMVEVLSNSMYPEFKKGDLLTIKLANKDSLVVGDAIAFYAPEQSGFTYGEGKPMVIYHEIIRIIYAENEQGLKVRYFVCKGTNVSPETEYVFIEPDVNGARGDYRFDKASGKYVSKKEDGNLANSYVDEYNYVAKLLNDDVKAEGNYDIDDVEDENMSVYQYVADDMVVGVYSGRVGGIIGAFIKLCSSSTGIVILVIIPSLLMIGLVVSGMIKESKDAKSNAEKDRKALNEVLNYEEEGILYDKSNKKNKKKDKDEDLDKEEIKSDNSAQPIDEENKILQEQAFSQYKVSEVEKASVINEDIKEDEPQIENENKESNSTVSNKVPPKKVPQKQNAGRDELKSQEQPLFEENKLKEVKEEPKVEELIKTPPKKVSSKAKPVEQAKLKDVEQKQEEVKAPQKVAPKKMPTPVEPKAEEVKELPKAPNKVAPEIKEQPKTAPTKVAPSVKAVPSAPQKAVPVAPVKEPPKPAPVPASSKVEEPAKVPPKKVPPKK